MGEPDYEGGDDDADVAEGVADDVEYHGTHAQVGMVVAMTAAAVLLGLVVVVADVPRVLADSLIAVAITPRLLESICCVGPEWRVLIWLGLLTRWRRGAGRVEVICALNVVQGVTACFDDLLTETGGVDVDIRGEAACYAARANLGAFVARRLIAVVSAQGKRRVAPLGSAGRLIRACELELSFPP